MRHIFNKDSAALKTTVEQECEEEDVELGKEEDTEQSVKSEPHQEEEVSSRGSSQRRMGDSPIRAGESLNLMDSLHPTSRAPNKMLLKTVSGNNDSEGIKIIRDKQKRTTRAFKESTETRISDLRDSQVGESALMNYQKYYKDNSRIIEKHHL